METREASDRFNSYQEFSCKRGRDCLSNRGERNLQRNAEFAVVPVSSASHPSESTTQGVGHGFLGGHGDGNEEQDKNQIPGLSPPKGGRDRFAP